MLFDNVKWKALVEESVPVLIIYSSEFEEWMKKWE